MTLTPIALNTRRSGRLSVAKLGQRPQPEPLPPVEPVAPLPARTPFERLASKNPAFTQLVESLDLVEVWSTKVTPVSLPELPEPVIIGPVSEKLKWIAEFAFEANQTYPEERAIAMLASITAVSTDRARKGLAMMMDQNLVEVTGSNEYYLSTSTPF